MSQVVIRAVFATGTIEKVTLPANPSVMNIHAALSNKAGFSQGVWTVGISEAQIVWNSSNNASSRDTMTKILSERMITQLLKANGGTDRDQILINEIADDFSMISAAYIKHGTCGVCLSNAPCLHLHSDCNGASCLRCLKTHFQQSCKFTDSSLSCTCRSNLLLKVRDLEARGLPAGTLGLVRAYNKTRRLTRLVNWQIHRCGALINLTTKFSKQICTACNETFCFFCNQPWNPDTMTNKEYCCGDQCSYVSMVTMHLQMGSWKEYSPSPGAKIPKARYCITCNAHCEYDKKCKFHTCTECGTKFCFFCLKDCKTSYNLAEPMVPQTLDMLYAASVAYSRKLLAE